jgi:hypothetical protein
MKRERVAGENPAPVSKTSVRGPGRPRKSVGLSLELSDGNAVQSVRETAGKSERPVLQGSCNAIASEAKPERLFATLDDKHGGGSQPAVEPQGVPDPAVVEDDRGLTGWLRKIIVEIAADEFQDGARRMTNAEVLARKMMQKALDGDKQLQEVIADRVEGKAGRAANVAPADTTLEDQLDRLDLDKLNAFAKKEVTLTGRIINS